MNWQLRRELLTNVAAIMGGGLQAALNLDFTTLTPATMATAGVTFSRASLAGQYDSTGKWTWAPNNLITYSEDFSQAAWGVAAGASKSAGFTDPLGGSTACQVTFGAQFGNIGNSFAATDGANYIGTLWVKWVSGNTTIQLSLSTAGGYLQQTNIAVTSTWTKFSLLKTGWSTAGNANVTIGLQDRAAGGQGVVLIAFGQCEQVTYETSARTYNASSASAYYGPRFDYNPSTLAARGLLIEEARTNLITRSEDFTHANWFQGGGIVVTANQTTSPDGTSNADKITTGIGIGGSIDETIGSTTATVYTSSCYLKVGSGVTWIKIAVQLLSVNRVSWFNISAGTVGTQTATSGAIENIGNGWYRCKVTSSANIVAGEGTLHMVPVDADGSSSFAGATGAEYYYAWGGQLEAGAFATSYIPTTSASATRAGDSATMTSSSTPTFASWYNQSEGTFIVEAMRTNGENGVGTIVVSDNSLNEYLGFKADSDFGLDWRIIDGGVQQADMYTAAGSTSSGSFFKAGFFYKVNDFGVCVNGGAISADTSGTIPTPNRLDLGTEQGGSFYFNGWFKSLKFYASRLADATVQSLTT